MAHITTISSIMQLRSIGPCKTSKNAA